MPREKESYRDNLELLLEAFPDKMMINKTEVQHYTGLDKETVNKLFTFNQCNKISLATLARQMS